MGAAWLIAGMVLGMVLAWTAEYLLDWRHRPRDAGLDADATRAVQNALARSETENAQLRNELMQVRAQLAEAQRTAGDGLIEPPPD